jgi:hypothetical protein
MNCDVDELKRSMQQIGACMTWMILSLLVEQLQKRWEQGYSQALCEQELHE